jgi:hypothetical protein
MGHASTSWRRHSGYATPSGYAGLGLKTAGDRFVGFGPQNQEDLRAARGIIEELVSRWSVFVKGLWPFNARNPTWYGYVCATLLLGHLPCVPQRHALRDHLG